MASPRERDHRRPPPQIELHHPARPSVRPSVRRHHFHDVPPWPHQRYGDYVYVDRGGWWPRWFPYWDPRWYVYWWYLYDHYGGDAYPEYAEHARDAVLRQYAPQWGLVVSGAWMGADPRDGVIVRDHRGDGANVRAPRGPSPVRAPRAPSPVHAPPSRTLPVHQPAPEHHEHPASGRPHYEHPHYEHPHYYYRDYVVVGRYWWPRWFPYWDPAWYRYWLDLYYYYGGAAHPDYALYAVDATLRAHARRLGWL